MLLVLGYLVKETHLQHLNRMATVKINCSKCCGDGLIGTIQLSVCTACAGKGMVTVNDTDTIATISAAQVVPIIATTPTVSTVAVAALKTKGKS